MSNPYNLPEEVVVELRRRLLHNKTAQREYVAAVAAHPKQRANARQTKLINYYAGKVSALEGTFDLLGLELGDPA